jgi:hypothetical protein
MDDMKKGIMNMMVTTMLVGIIGCNASAADTSKTASNNIMNDNVGIGVIQIVKDSVQVQHSKTREEFDRLTSVIENRNGRIIIEMIDATVLDDDGNGSDSFGFYVKYDSGQFSKGDKVRSVFVYNPDTNYLDDIVCRVDWLIE